MQPSDLTEKEWQTQLVELATLLGWRKTYHVYDSRRSHSGWPDIVLLRDRIVYVEVKTERGKLSDSQKDWLRAIVAAGGEAYVARPRNLDALASVLGARRATTTYLTTASATEARNGLLRELEKEIAA